MAIWFLEYAFGGPREKRSDLDRRLTTLVVIEEQYHTNAQTRAREILMRAARKKRGKRNPFRAFLWYMAPRKHTKVPKRSFEVRHRMRNKEDLLMAQENIWRGAGSLTARFV